MDLDPKEFKALKGSGHNKLSHSHKHKKGLLMTSNLLSDDSKIRYLNLTNVPSEVDWRGKAVSKVKIFTTLRFKIKVNAVDVGHFPQLEPWRVHTQWLVTI